ncbi:hypothetical protein QLX08_001159 [Tetragonisca angustula]|uniref:Uncharacterized protein n=1 Tax=Tetragonisca angustula TaxID=166442 RepID=A0AAW1AGP1_9HYME
MRSLRATKQCTLTPTVDGRKCISINRPFDGAIEWRRKRKRTGVRLEARNKGTGSGLSDGGRRETVG